jgi:sulfopyruvate decarboxylase TPP-binding subunit
MLEKCMEVPISREENGNHVVSKTDIAGKHSLPFQGDGT